MAHPMGFYSKQGLNVEVVKTAGWAVIRDKSLAKEYDAAHMLSPMPLAISLGVGSNPVPWTMPAIENINGQAITLAIKHKDKRDPKDWKGFRFAVPFDYSMHNYLLRYYVAEHGLDPDKDISIRSVPPPEMVANLRADNIDGYLGPDPFNQRAVFDGIGFIHLLTKELWDGHPCCAFTVSKEFATQNPNAYRALLKSIIDATAYASKQENRKEIAKAIAPANYLNQPETVLEQILTGTYADGLGAVKKDPNRIDFDPFPWNQFAIWIMTQMKRWGQLKGDVDYAKVAADVYLATDTANMMKEMGLTPPDPLEEDHRGHGQGVRSRASPTNTSRASPSSGADGAMDDAQDVAPPAGRVAVAADLRRHRRDLAGRHDADGRQRPGDRSGICQAGRRRSGHRHEVGDADTGRYRRHDLEAPGRSVLRARLQRQGHRHPARLFAGRACCWASRWRRWSRCRSAS